MKAVGKGLNLCCICPSKKPFVVSTPESFSKLPNGGCQKHCESRLLCGHQCVLSGTCDLCQHGQLHLQCQETYEKTSICGHVYSGLCRETCLPCMLPYENRCPHSRCTRLCSEVCNTCKEVCTWSCEHQKCTKLCSEPCDRKPCKNICQKLLKCNHQLNGFDYYMKDFAAKQKHYNSIQLPLCPKCKSPICRYARYNSIVNEIQLWIEKMKLNQQYVLITTVIAQRQKKLTSKLSSYIKSNNNTTLFENLLALLLNQTEMTLGHLNYIENTFIFLKEINHLSLNIKQQFSEVDDRYQQINDYLQRISFYVDEQNYEIKVKKIQVNVGSEQKTILNELKILTSKYRPFIMKNCQRFDMLYEQIKNVLNLSELCTTKDQQIQIVSETDGHKLFLCSNGHPYMRYSETDQSSHCHECTLQTGESTH
ncbi:unnamed protein product [Didymodactylos carnosus]|uniref:NFX1-type zinc finger-containing protein 1 n=1 Tax=Didymodactylos carnosus TaxID=1234261 RepID=A0A814N7C5_9BILA|nr:unnamed protein product [Didymodactylos carnosus]CAF3854921.1 unnamed protein product [Didymodactylos carnosus]